MEKIKLK